MEHHSDSDSANRQRLAEFLRTRRERLHPEAFGLAPLGRRRTPGLRREEVAQLVGISIAYYTWMEQGRPINISREVLAAIARTLHFTDAERAYIFTLTGIERCPSACAAERGVHPALEHLLSGSADTCCLKYDRWLTVVGASALAAAVFGFSPRAAAPPNLLEAIFTDAAHRRLWVDWETEARLITGMYRQTLALYPDDADGEARLERLRGIPDFERIWRDVEVHLRPSPQAYFRRDPWHLRHPAMGRLSLYRVAMAVPNTTRRELALYTPADEITAGRLRTLVQRAESPLLRFDDRRGA